MALILSFDEPKSIPYSTGCHRIEERGESAQKEDLRPDSHSNQDDRLPLDKRATSRDEPTPLYTRYIGRSESLGSARARDHQLTYANSLRLQKPRFRQKTMRSSAFITFLVRGATERPLLPEEENSKLEVEGPVTRGKKTCVKGFLDFIRG